MKKIIGGKLYNTETAQAMGTYSNGGGWRDFNHFEETLYRKKTGEYFLHGVGNANTKYSVSVDSNTWSGGEAITPLTLAEAKQWVADHLEVDDYLNIFLEEVEE